MITVVFVNTVHPVEHTLSSRKLVFFVISHSPSPRIIVDMLNNGDPGYIEEDQSPMLYSIASSFLAAALYIVILR